MANDSTQVKNFERVNGLGKISISPELITSIIQKVLSSYKGYEYISHNIDIVSNNYYEVSIMIKICGSINHKEIDKLHKELLLVMKQSLSLTCVVILNIQDGK